ncbi:MAG: thioredoxin family protein [Methanomassiliicoccales archaeon]|nr:MAG: thioredoxin family protein [Methanomassiliicoccales archaeon]
MTKKGERLIWFWGRECPHCKQIRPTVEQLEKELNIKLEHLEVWHNQENQRLMQEYGDVISEACGGELGVPAFYNERKGKALCGYRISLDKMKEWASGK